MTVRICFVGDSYVDGTGDPECLGWVGRVCRNAWERGNGLTFYNLGVRGDTTACVERRWRRECDARVGAQNGGRLVFSFGINDGAEGSDGGQRLAIDVSLEHARRMISLAAQWLPIVWIGPPPANERMSPISPFPGVSYSFSNDRLLALNDAFTGLARELGVPYLDIAATLVDHERYQASLVTGDGIHCSAEGYGIIAEMVDAWPAWRRLAADDRSPT
jgi:acyl-CoA thioesterase-1